MNYSVEVCSLSVPFPACVEKLVRFSIVLAAPARGVCHPIFLEGEKMLNNSKILFLYVFMLFQRCFFRFMLYKVKCSKASEQESQDNRFISIDLLSSRQRPDLRHYLALISPDQVLL